MTDLKDHISSSSPPSWISQYANILKERNSDSIARSMCIYPGLYSTRYFSSKRAQKILASLLLDLSENQSSFQPKWQSIDAWIYNIYHAIFPNSSSQHKILSYTLTRNFFASLVNNLELRAFSSRSLGELYEILLTPFLFTPNHSLTFTDRVHAIERTLQNVDHKSINLSSHLISLGEDSKKNGKISDLKLFSQDCDELFQKHNIITYSQYFERCLLHLLEIQKQGDGNHYHVLQTNIQRFAHIDLVGFIEYSATDRKILELLSAYPNVYTHISEAQKLIQNDVHTKTESHNISSPSKSAAPLKHTALSCPNIEAELSYAAQIAQKYIASNIPPHLIGIAVFGNNTYKNYARSIFRVSSLQEKNTSNVQAVEIALPQTLSDSPLASVIESLQTFLTSSMRSQDYYHLITDSILWKYLLSEMTIQISHAAEEDIKAISQSKIYAENVHCFLSSYLLEMLCEYILKQPLNDVYYRALFSHLPNFNGDTFARSCVFPRCDYPKTMLQDFYIESTQIQAHHWPKSWSNLLVKHILDISYIMLKPLISFNHLKIEEDKQDALYWMQEYCNDLKSMIMPCLYRDQMHGGKNAVNAATIKKIEHYFSDLTQLTHLCSSLKKFHPSSWCAYAPKLLRWILSHLHEYAIPTHFQPLCGVQVLNFLKAPMIPFRVMIVCGAQNLIPSFSNLQKLFPSDTWDKLNISASRYMQNHHQILTHSVKNVIYLYHDNLAPSYIEQSTYIQQHENLTSLLAHYELIDLEHTKQEIKDTTEFNDNHIISSTIPPYRKVFETISASSFKSLITCPYSFYLKQNKIHDFPSVRAHKYKESGIWLHQLMSYFFKGGWDGVSQISRQTRHHKPLQENDDLSVEALAQRLRQISSHTLRPQDFITADAYFDLQKHHILYLAHIFHHIFDHLGFPITLSTEYNLNPHQVIYPQCIVTERHSKFAYARIVGNVDAVLDFKNFLLVIDYKANKLPAKSRIVAGEEPQLFLYDYALQHITGKPCIIAYLSIQTCDMQVVHIPESIDKNHLIEKFLTNLKCPITIHNTSSKNQIPLRITSQEYENIHSILTKTWKTRSHSALKEPFAATAGQHCRHCKFDGICRTTDPKPIAATAIKNHIG